MKAKLNQHTGRHCTLEQPAAASRKSVKGGDTDKEQTHLAIHMPFTLLLRC